MCAGRLCSAGARCAVSEVESSRSALGLVLELLIELDELGLSRVDAVLIAATRILVFRHLELAAGHSQLTDTIRSAVSVSMARRLSLGNAQREQLVELSLGCRSGRSGQAGPVEAITGQVSA